MNLNFDIPDGYFDELPDKIMQKIVFEDKKEKLKRNFIVRSVFFAAAAVLCAGIFLPILFQNANSSIANTQKVSTPDYNASYALDLLSTSTDEAALYYTSFDEQKNSKTDFTEIIINYPTPITINNYYEQ